MNEIMSYQYPPPGTPPPPYDTGYPVPPHSTGMDMRSPGQPGRNGSPAMSFDLKRSSSHPNVKMDPSSAAGLDEQTMAAGGDKKRGKLNYHRASTACTNCRKRKIRCQPGSVGQQKCKTCEKLNKDCKYESVNHQSPADTRHMSITRTPAGHKLASASSGSSPAISSGHPVEIHTGQHHGAIAMPPIQHMALADPPDLKMAPGSMGRTYPEYSSQGMAAHWMGPEAGTGSARAKHTSWGSYGQETTPITSTFPQYTHTTPPPQTAGWAAPVPGEPGPRNDMSWGSYPPPNQPFSPMSQMATPNAYDRKTPTSSMPPAEMYPPLPNMTPGPSMDHSPSSLSPPQPSSQASGYGSWQQQSYPPISNKPGDGYGGGWYSQGEEGHALPAPMSHGVPTGAYYAQR